MAKVTYSKKIVEDYIHNKDWRVKENSNATKSFGALGKHIISEVSKDYWLRSVYPESIAKAYVSGDIHIHDLGALSVYCCGYSLESIIRKGVVGVPNIPTSAPAKHFDSILNQIANLTTVFQNEIAGAVAFNMVDTLLAPFIKIDNLSYDQVKQSMQNFIFSINSNSRGGAEPAFTNVTLDITPSADLLNMNALVGGERMPFTYKDCQPEIDMFNKAFCEVMLEGDSKGNAFAYPIPTYNIHERFDWENPNNEIIFEMAGKYGYPYFANFLNSDMSPEDIRSMCCRLSLDLTALSKRNGGLFGSGDSTGSIGVVTLNLPRYGYISTTEEELFEAIEHNMVLAKDSLVIKRNFLQKEVLDGGLIPAFKEYVGTLHNHFSTIGLIGANEMCVNFLGKDITSEEGIELSKKVLEFMNNKLIEFQEETGVLFNLEATPAESTSYALALKDKNLFGDKIFSQGSGENIYYTNSTNLPVNSVESIKGLFDHQDQLVPMYTGGTVVHVYLDGPISTAQAKSLIKNACKTYKVPYISLSPINRYCPTHGFIEQRTSKCPECGSELKLMQRVTGYLRAVENFNKGKTAEFYDREQLNTDKA